jgi:ribokinase
MNNPIFLAIGDLVTDAFIELENATVTCNIDHENCTISMPFGDKIPYTDVTVLRAVGNSPNAAVAAARLGLSTSLLTNIGDDDEGQKAITQLQSENIDTKNVTKHTGIKTNYHYVLRYGAERTILIKHEHYPYQFTAPAIIPDVVYLSSLGAGTEEYHNQVLAWLESNPDIILAFQPGTFQMKLGTEKLAGIYKRTNVFFCNKQEAQKILGLPDAGFPELHNGIRVLGPNIVVITDGPGGMTASDENNGYFLPIYPDPQPPVERTGAGDACSSSIAIALSLGLSLDQAIMWGPINSMSVVQQVGAQAGLLSREQLEKYLTDAPEDYKPVKIW